LGGAYQPVLDRVTTLGVVGSLPIMPPSLSGERLTGIKFVIVAAHDHPLASLKGTIEKSELTKHVQLVLTDRSSLSEGREFGVMSPQTWRLGDLFAKHAFLLNGLGWGGMPRHVVERDITEGRLVELAIEDWEKVGYDVPLLVNMQPAGAYLGEDYFRAGGLPAVMHELLTAGRLHGDAPTINGKTIGENVAHAKATNAGVIRSYDKPLKPHAGFKVFRGNLFDCAIMKTSVISEEFRQRYLSNPKSPNAFEGRAVVFDGPEDYHHRVDDPALGIDEHTILFMRGAGPIGYPGSAEVVNMQPPAALIKRGVTALPCIGDGRQSGTSGSPSILNASPEAADGGGLALLRTGDRVRIDLNKGTADMLVPSAELAERRAALKQSGGYRYPPSQTPWQEIQRAMVDQPAAGMVLEPAVKYQRVAQKYVPRDNH